ncbi:MAG: type II secretion system protein [Verrucomicrobia bacterium]|nr:type II secretion system protein [Verrucomicrobiota bacterium]MBI3869555.1 type II secretion system protein [Verrucomicrobiota bacterium]
MNATPRNSKRLKRKAAFTLIELLVVVAVIGILAAMILPSLARAKRIAHQTECLNLIRQWAIAFHSYTLDNDGMIPREGYHDLGSVYLNSWPQVMDDKSKDTWYNGLASYMNNLPASRYGSYNSRPSFYGRNALFHCPSARLPKETLEPNTQIAIFSLAMNSFLIESPNVPTISFNRIKSPAKTVLFLDNLLEGEPKVDEDQAKNNLGQPSSEAARFAGVRHDGKGNLAFGDLHVESLPGNKVVQTNPGRGKGGAIEPEVEIIWFPDLR